MASVGPVPVLNRFRSFLNPGNAACIAALLVAVGVEVDQVLVHHILEILGAIIAVIGFFTAANPQ